MGYDMTTVGEQKKYFRLNIFGMSRYRDAMIDFNMVYDTDYPEPGFNHTHDTDGPADEYNPDGTCLQCDELLRSHPGDFKGIPIFKLCSNDGWLVTPVECVTAVQRWEERGSPVPNVNEPEYWLEWIDYLREAAEDGGFRVY